MINDSKLANSKKGLKVKKIYLLFLCIKRILHYVIYIWKYIGREIENFK